MRNSKGQFVNGSKDLTQEERLKLSRSLSESWRKRPNFIGDMKEKYPRVFNSWRAIHYTEKGKRAGCSDEWSDFRAFCNDVLPSYQKGLMLRRKDTHIPWSKDNFIWVSSEEARDLMSGTCLEWEGKTMNLRQWSDYAHQPLSAIKNRFYKHRNDYSIEEIIFGRQKNRHSKKVKDVMESRIPIRAKAAKMISSYKVKDKSAGMEVCDIDIDWMIDNILTKPCCYCGDTRRIGCDRIDNSIGHIKSNVVPCCIECNTARNDYFTFDEMKILGKTIASIKSARGNSFELDNRRIEKERKRDLEYRRQRTMRETYQWTIDGTLIKRYNSVNEAAITSGFSAKSISAAAMGFKKKKEEKKHRLGDYLWSHDNVFPGEKITIEIK